MTAAVAVLVVILTGSAPAREAPRPAPEVRAARTAHDTAPSGVWTALADCESDGRWSYDGPSGYDGGLQFHPSTWSAYRSAGDPPYAWQASPARQVAVAELVLAEQGWGAWPACARALGLR